MNPYGCFGGGMPGGCGDGGADGGGGGFGQMAYSGGGNTQGWWAPSPYDAGGCGGINGWGGGGGCGWNGGGGGYSGKDTSKGSGKGFKGGATSAPAGGKGKGKAVCKFFLEGRCARGDSCAFRHEAAADADEDSDPEMREIQAAIERAQGQASGKKDEEEAVLESLRRAEEDDVRADQAARTREADKDSDAGDALPPPASEAEIEEARQIVQKAQREAAEREKMKAKAKTASRDDLQAMINARLGMK